MTVSPNHVTKDAGRITHSSEGVNTQSGQRSAPIVYNQTSLKKPGWIPYFFDTNLKKWRHINDASYELLNTDAKKRSYSQAITKFETELQEAAAAEKAALSWMGKEGINQYSFHKTPFIYKSEYVGVKDSKSVIPIFIMGEYGSSEGDKSYRIIGGGLSSHPLYDPNEREIERALHPHNVDRRSDWSQEKLKYLIMQSLHDVYTIVPPTHAQQTEAANNTPWRPFIGWKYSNQEHPKIPALSWYLYNQDPANFRSQQVKDTIRAVKSKYKYWANQYYGTTNITEDQFRKILVDELNEKKDAKAKDMARISFQKWYQPIVKAQQDLEAAQTEEDRARAEAELAAAAQAEIDPVVQDSEQTLATMDATDEYVETVESKNRLPLYILGAVGISVAIYIGYLAYKKKYGSKNV